MLFKKDLRYVFFILSFLVMVFYFVCVNDAGYAGYVSPNMGSFIGLRYSGKSAAAVQNASTFKNSSFYALFGLNGWHSHRIVSACGMECQNILTNIFTPFKKIAAFFVFIFLLYIFVQKLLVLSINHPPKSLIV